VNERRAGRHHVQVLGANTLKAANQLGIDTELQDGAAARLARELGVHHLVRPGPERARHVDPQQHVRAAAPAAARKRRLGDGACAVPHGVDGARGRLRRRLVRHVHHGDAACPQVVEVAALVR
jgi:hypothetical protein